MFLKLMTATFSSVKLLTFFIFVHSSQALPQDIVRAASFEITKPFFESFELIEHYAAASYCPQNTIDSKDAAKLACPKSNNCAKVESANTTILLGIKNFPLTDVTGFIATDATNNLTVVSFQGTESKKQMQVDFNLNLLNISQVCAGCTAHTGFWQSWNETRLLVIQAIQDSRKKFPNNRIVVTGHSLGGAISTLAAAELRSTGVPIDLYTFGAPRVGNRKLADYVQAPAAKLGNNYRATHYNDPVPRLPLARMGYAHYTPEFYISTKNSNPVALSEILQLDASTTSKGNEQFSLLDVEAHRWYINAISACYAANNPSNGTSNDLATNWAPAIITLMGNSSGLVLVGGNTANMVAVSAAISGLIAAMGTQATNSLLSMIPGGFLAAAFIPSATTVGGLTAGTFAGLGELLSSGTSASGLSGLLSSIGSLLGKAGR